MRAEAAEEKGGPGEACGLSRASPGLLCVGTLWAVVEVIHKVWDGAWESAFPTQAQETSVLLVSGPHFEE